MGRIARSGGVRVATLAREEPRPLPGIRLPPPRAVIPRLFHRAAASLASLLPGRGDSHRRRDRVLDQALANLLREAESTHDDIVKRIPARLHRLDQAVRRHGDPDLARARLQDGARAYLRNVDGPTLQALAALRQRGLLSHARGAARTARAWAGAGAGQSGCRGSAVEAASWRWRRVGARPRRSRGLAAVLDEIPAQAGARRRCGTGRHLGWRVEPGAAPGEGSACGAHRRRWPCHRPRTLRCDAWLAR